MESGKLTAVDVEQVKEAGRRELLPIIALGGAAAAALAFGWLAEEVGEGDTRAFDTALLLALREPNDPANPIGPPWLEETARDFTALGSNGVLVFAVLATCLFLILARKRAAAATVAVAAGGGLGLLHLLKHCSSARARSSCRTRRACSPPAFRAATR